MDRGLFVLPVLILIGGAQTAARRTPAATPGGMSLAPHSKPVWVSKINLPQSMNLGAPLGRRL